MKKNLFFVAFLMLFAVPIAAQADVPQFQRYIGDVNQKGQGRLKYLVWDVYDATLYSGDQGFSLNAPFALKLDYLISLKGKDIVSRSIDEMRGQGFKDEETLERWGSSMKAIFPDVEKGISITGLRDARGNTIFYKNDIKIGEIKDPEFTKAFFDIWLGQKTSQPKLRQQLLGLK